MSRSLRGRLRAARTVGRTYGPRGAFLRAVHEVRCAAGLFRDRPRHSPSTLDPPGEHPFRVDPERLRVAADREVALRRADRVARGEYQAYRGDWRRFPDAPEAWLRHPITGRARGPAPWWRVPHLAPELGDIKDLWEPARFAWSYDLVRGYLITGDDRYARAFHDRLAMWGASSPPFRGPHWACGQESSIRAAALLYAEANLADAPSSTGPAMERLALVLAATGERVEDAIGYAISQRNNHGVSEAVGLILLGARFHGRHPRAARWLRRGRRWLERLVREQFAPDGWYIQHSFNYLRLALDQCVLAERALGSVDDGLSEGAVDRLAAAVELLGWVIDSGSGTVPNHGANDGAFIHPITTAGYRDFRPVLTAVCATFDLPVPGPIAADPEVLAWLDRDKPVVLPGAGAGVRTGPSGWAVARVGPTMVFLRAGSYDSRPSHIDPLHIDVRLGGRELVVDPGTFAYAGPGQGDWRLAGADLHNGPRVDGRPAARSGPRFLWLEWPRARVVSADWDGEAATLVAESHGRARRRVRVTTDSVTIRDEALPADAVGMCVGWLLHPDADPGAVETDPPARVHRGDANSERGWFCPGYGRRLPAHRIEVRCERPAELVVTTTLREPSRVPQRASPGSPEKHDHRSIARRRD